MLHLICSEMCEYNDIQWNIDINQSLWNSNILYFVCLLFSKSWPFKELLFSSMKLNLRRTQWTFSSRRSQCPDLSCQVHAGKNASFDRKVQNIEEWWNGFTRQAANLIICFTNVHVQAHTLNRKKRRNIQ
jgi:hypothetical protein